MNQEKQEKRQTADEDFMRSLNQLETLLQADSPAENNPLENTATPQTLNRFGGSLLDAIPLAQRLGNRLEHRPTNCPTQRPTHPTQTPNS